jgi:hypothetical protein
MAELTRAGKCAKYFLFIFNLIVALVGLVLLVISVWFLVDPKAIHYVGIASDDGSLHLVRATSVTVLVVSVCSLFVGVVGCWGAWKEKTNCLICYATIITALVLGEIVAVILAGVSHGTISAELQKTMNQSLQQDYKGLNDSESRAWDYMQSAIKCCGVERPSDWQTSWWFQYQNKTSEEQTVPDSCCVPEPHGVQPLNATLCYTDALHANSSDYVYTQGCKPSLENWVELHLGIFILLALVLLLVELAVVVLACVLRRNINLRPYEHV